MKTRLNLLFIISATAIFTATNISASMTQTQEEKNSDLNLENFESITAIKIKKHQIKHLAKNKLDLNDTEALTNETFTDLIKNRDAFVFAVTVTGLSNKKDAFHFYDAYTLNKYLIKNNNFINPLNKTKINNILYFLYIPKNSELKSNTFYIGSKSDLWNNEDKVKNILLALISNLNDKKDSNQLIDIGLLLEFNKIYKNLDLAIHFYKLAAKDLPEANFMLYIIYHNKGNTTASKKYLEKAAATEKDKIKLFGFAFLLLSRFNNTLDLGEEATFRACQILDFLKQIGYKDAKNIDPIIKVFVSKEE